MGATDPKYVKTHSLRLHADFELETRYQRKQFNYDFTVVVEPCDPGSFLIAEPPSEQTYTISEAAKVLTIADFKTIGGDECDIVYDSGTSPTTSLVTFDPLTREVVFFEASDLQWTDEIGPSYSKTYTVTIDALSGISSNEIYSSTSFTLKVLNPCNDSNFSSIVTSEVSRIIEYQIGQPSVSIDLTAINFTSKMSICGSVSKTVSGMLNSDVKYD